MLKRIRVVLGAAPTYLVTAATVVAVAAPELANAFPDQAQTITTVALRIGAVLAAAVTIVRRVTPVDAEDRGLL